MVGFVASPRHSLRSAPGQMQRLFFSVEKPSLPIIFHPRVPLLFKGMMQIHGELVLMCQSAVVYVLTLTRTRVTVNVNVLLW